jgi:leucyl-tRNA synthetase
MQVKGKGGKDKTPVTAVKPTDGSIYVAKTFPPWQSCVLDTMRDLYEKNSNSLPDNKAIAVELGKKEVLKKFQKRVMPFAQMVREKVEQKGGPGKEAMAVTLGFDEAEVLSKNLEYLRVTLDLESLDIKFTDDSTASEKIQESTRPGAPFITFSTKPFIRAVFENPVPRSGLFTNNINISDGDTTKTIKEKLGKCIGVKGENFLKFPLEFLFHIPSNSRNITLEDSPL